MDLASLPNDPQALKQMIAWRETQIEQTRAELARCHAEHEALVAELRDRHAAELEQFRHRLSLLLRRLYGPRSESLDAAQLLLFAHAIEQAQVDPAERSPETPEPLAGVSRRIGHGRRPLPADLPRHRIEHPIDPKQIPCPCCGLERVKIGEDLSEQLEHASASLFVLQHARPKLACRHCEGQGDPANILIAGKPAQPIDKGLPGPGLLAHVIVSKYGDHLPLYRLESIFARHGVQISRSTMCGWMAAAAALLRPLHGLMADRLRQSPVIWTDDTPVPVQDPDHPGKTKTGRLWVYLGDDEHPYIAYDYTPSRSRDGPAAWLKNHKGYLQADAFGGYDGIYASQQVTEVACWAHARRKFFDAKDTDATRAGQMLSMIRELYRVEEQARALDPDARRSLRQTHSLPVLAKIKAWLDSCSSGTALLPKSVMGQAMAYTLKLWPALTVYSQDGRLSIDNNPSERALRRVAIGRKNWLFAGSDAGGVTASVLYSFVASAQRHGLDPEAYLRGVLARLPETPIRQIDQFLPDRWKADLRAEGQITPKP